MLGCHIAMCKNCAKIAENLEPSEILHINCGFLECPEAICVSEAIIRCYLVR